MPDTSEVPISEKWIAAEAAAGPMPAGDEEGGRRDAVAHAQRPVDELRRQPHEREEHQSAHASLISCKTIGVTRQ